MGTIVAVDSVVYNLAGDELERPSYLKSLVVRNVISGTKVSIADDLRSGYMNGPAMKLRDFFRWAARPANYNQVGIPTGTLNLSKSLDAGIVAPFIPVGVGMTALGQTAKTGIADYNQWVEQYILANRPDDIDTAWSANIDQFTGDITITWVDTTTTTFTPANFSLTGRYIYTHYTTAEAGTTGAVTTGSVITLASGQDYPDTDDWTDLSGGVFRLVSTDSDETGVVEVVQTMYQFFDGVTQSYRIDEQINTYATFSGTLIWIYKIGDGNSTLDNLAANPGGFDGRFFPFIPFRIENKFLSETYYPAAFPQVKKAYKKATGRNLSELIDKVADNESLNEIDHAYVTFGVSLNVRENECRKYAYTFFQSLMESQRNTAGYDAYLTALAIYNAQVAARLAWQASPSGPRPLINKAPVLPPNVIKIQGTGALNSRYNVALNWDNITETTMPGVGVPGAKPGDVTLKHHQTIDIITTYIQPSRDAGDRIMTRKTGEKQVMRIYWQRTDTSYTYLEVTNCVYTNYVYGSHVVTYDTKEALADTDESGFILPLHYDIWNRASLVSTSQMATACMFVVFNCYKVKKTKWYQSGIFKIFLVIVIAIVSAIFTGGGGFGLLGSNLLIGTSLGFTGLTAAIVGSIVNAIAGLIVSTLLTTVLGRLGVIGQVLSFVFMFVAGQVASGFSTGSLAIQWGDLLRADNLMKLMDSVGNGVADMLRNSTLEMQKDWSDFAKNAKDEAAKIQQAYFEEFGYGAGAIDPFMFVDSVGAPIAESSDTFLTRTLMTGSDISGMSQELLSGFAEYSLTLPNAFT